MVDLLIAFLAGAAATLVPLYAGIIGPRILAGMTTTARAPLLIAAAASGILFWFFLDVMGDAALLDSSQGFSVDYPTVAVHLALVVLFFLGLGALFWLEKNLSHRKASQAGENHQGSTANNPSSLLGVTYAVAITAALGIGFHALGEGYSIGALLPKSIDILDAIGGFNAGTAYVLHKLLEGFVVGAFALLASSTSWKRLGVLGLVSGLPTILGFLVGVPEPIGIGGSTYFFAIGGAGAVYAELRLIPQFLERNVKYAPIVAFLVGFYSMYIAGLFHSAG